MIVGVTGHRPDKLGGWRPGNPVQRKVRAALHDALVELRPAMLLTGMALGVDQWAAETCLDLHIPYTAVIPFEGQARPWPPASQRQYQFLVAHAAERVVVCEGEFKPWKLQRRNEWVVDRCALLLAVWDGSRGGTGNCVAYAESVQREIRRLSWLDYVIN